MSSIDKMSELLKEGEIGIFRVRMGNLYVKELIKDYFNGKVFSRVLFAQPKGTAIHGYVSSNGKDTFDISIENSMNNKVILAVQAVKGSTGRWSVRIACSNTPLYRPYVSNVPIKPHTFPNYMYVSPDSFSLNLTSNESLGKVVKMLDRYTSILSYEYYKLGLYLAAENDKATKRFFDLGVLEAQDIVKRRR
jgi:hypothetical protein